MRVTIVTAQGRPAATFTIVPDALHAPRTANSFLFLACTGYYGGSPIDRLIPSLLVEGGALPAGKPGPGYSFSPEPAQGQYGRGTVALVDAGSPVNGGRFFILLDRFTLPPTYTILGAVSAGIASLDRLSRARTTLQPDAQEQSLPAMPLRIASMALTVR